MIGKLWVLGLVGFFLTGTSDGAQLAAASAADPGYDAGWGNGTPSNGGVGWGGPWSFVDGVVYAFTGSSATNGVGDPDGDGDINTPAAPPLVPGECWLVGIYWVSSVSSDRSTAHFP